MASGLAIGISLLLGVTLGVHALVLVGPLVLLAGKLRPHRPRWLAAIVVACVLLGALRGGSAESEALRPLFRESEQAIGLVTSLPVAGGDFERAILRLEHVRDADGTWQEASGLIIVYLPDQRDGASLHDRIQVRWDVTHVSALAPGYAGYVRSQGATGSAWVWSYEIEKQGPNFFQAVSNMRRSVSRVLMTALPGDSGALASGFVTGDDSGLREETQEAFRNTGTAHLTSVSGQNISLLISFMSLWYRPTGRARRVAVHTAMLLVVWTYAVMVGMEAPALRASVVASLTIIGTYSGRKPDPLTLMALTLGGMAVIDPMMTHSIGFWLSAAASLALCSVVMPDAPPGFRRQVLNVIMGPLAASLATMPILVWTFHEWSPITPLANALLAPIMTVLFPVVYIFAGVALLPFPSAPLVAWLPGIGLDLSISVIYRIDSIATPLYLDGIGATGALLVAMPCVAAIGVMSREGERWLRIVQRAW